MRRQQRGHDRREDLIQAGARLLTSTGPGNFSARRVAAEAGVPLAAVTYYFESLTELLGLVTDRVVAGWLDHGNRVAQSFINGDIADPATALILAMVPGSAALPVTQWRMAILARYEQLLSAGRNPVVSAALAAVRPALHELITTITEHSATPITLSAATILAVIDGAAVGAISENVPDPVAFMIDTLCAALR